MADFWSDEWFAAVNTTAEVLPTIDGLSFSFDVEVADKVAHLKMIRPDKANSMVPSFWRDPPEIVDEWSA